MQTGIGLHIIHPFPASNTVRDRCGGQKQMFFGDALRAMMSSQSAKFAIRQSPIFQDALAGMLSSERTRHLSQLVAEELRSMGVAEEDVQKIALRAQDIGAEGKNSKSQVKDEDPEDGEEETGAASLEFPQRTRQPFYISQEEIRTLAESLLAAYQDEDTYKGEKGAGIPWEKVKMSKIARHFRSTLPASADIRLFGRFSTSLAFQDIPSAVAVMHAFSTHAIRPFNDEWTAVDTYIPQGGAAGMDATQLNASVYYFYYHIDWMQLLANFDLDVETASKVAKAFIKAAIYMTPKSYHNSTAPVTFPDFVMAEIIQDDRPRNYASAFQVALPPLSSLAVEKLVKKVHRFDQCFPMPGIENRRFWLSALDEEIIRLNGIQVDSVNEMLTRIATQTEQTGEA